ncbi:MAG: hypothetical protein AAEJ43_11330 [Gammaproteobacteria bacterium]
MNRTNGVPQLTPVFPKSTARVRHRAKFKKFEITSDDALGFRLGKLGYREDRSIGAVEGEVEFIFPNVLRLDIADGTSDGLYRVVIMPTPVDADNACAYYVRARRGREAASLATVVGALQPGGAPGRSTG